LGECYIHQIRSINLIIIKKDMFIWGTLKNTEAEEKLVPKKEELVREIKENNEVQKWKI